MPPAGATSVQLTCRVGAWHLELKKGKGPQVTGEPKVGRLVFRSWLGLENLEDPGSIFSRDIYN